MGTIVDPDAEGALAERVPVHRDDELGQTAHSVNRMADELARRLPDTTSLEKAAIEGDRVLLIGLSTEASALVGSTANTKPAAVAASSTRRVTTPAPQ